MLCECEPRVVSEKSVRVHPCYRRGGGVVAWAAWCGVPNLTIWMALGRQISRMGEAGAGPASAWKLWS